MAKKIKFDKTNLGLSLDEAHRSLDRLAKACNNSKKPLKLSGGYRINKTKGNIEMRKHLKFFLIGLAIGIIITIAACAGMVSAYQEEVLKIKEQYRDCLMIGEYPTAADMRF